MISFGNFIFRWRDTLFSIIFALSLAFIAYPLETLTNSTADLFLSIFGAVVVFFGLLLRLLTFSYTHIKRSGLEKKIHTGTLAQDALYAHCRNPLYLANLCVLSGLSISANFLHFYAILPFFYFMYMAIMLAEEDYLLRKFAQEYLAYMKRVPRLLPAQLSSFHKNTQECSFAWKRALRIEKGTLLLVPFALLLIHIFKLRFAWQYAWLSPPILTIAMIAVLFVLLSSLLHTLAKKGILEH